MAFTNRCFPTKVVPVWTRPFTEESHARIVASYFQYSVGGGGGGSGGADTGAAGWAEIGVADMSPDGWAGQRDPAVVVMARK